MDLNRLFCIDLDLSGMEGFRKFISSWLYMGDEFTLVVDPGPLSTIPHLCRTLRAHGVEKLDYILLTHIHIDHAGGTGALLREFPDARVICHPDGIRHMISPQKLWEGSRAVLGKLAEAYGEIIPVPAEKISFEEAVGDTGIKVFLTPGHAQHHCCYLLDELLFAGEVAGTHAAVPDGIYMRPATPPRFMLDVARNSVEKVMALAPRYLAFAHYGLVENGVEYLQIAHRQLQLWVKGVAITAGIEESKRQDALIAWLMEHDSNYRNFSQLPADIQARERYFFGNTFRGMAEYVDSLADEQVQALMLS